MVATDLKITAAGDSVDTVSDTAGHVLIPTAGKKPRPVHANGFTCGRRCMWKIRRELFLLSRIFSGLSSVRYTPSVKLRDFV